MSDDQKISLEEARERYAIEREKRLRPEANAQYHDLTGEFEEFDHDPYSPPIVREPITEHTQVVIVGGGFGGMLTGANLTKLGITDFRIIEKGGDFGGTWYWNRYPGCMCDVESYVYLPMLEETGFMPTMKYAYAPEIFEYCQLLGRTFDLYDGALFQTEVADMTWDDEAQLWTTVTDRGDRLTSKYVVIAGGVLSKAKLPGIPGIETFTGPKFHTSRWDYSQTGGGPYDRMEKLEDKVVGVIGTGATAVQVVPAVARSAKELFVFQRTPASVGVRNQGPTDEEWFKSLKPGWQKERIENFTQAVTGSQPEKNLVGDTWTKMLWVDTRNVPKDDEEAAYYEREDFEQMQALRDRVDEIVDDPATAELLKPWYSKFCKRPCFHDDYLPAFNRDNVHLVDTDGHGVDRITENAVVVARRRVPGRHPRVRLGLRGHHRLPPPPRLRPQGPRRRVDERVVGRGPPHPPRRAHPRLPEPDDDQDGAGRVRHELRPLPHRDLQARGRAHPDLRRARASPPSRPPPRPRRSGSTCS